MKSLPATIIEHSRLLPEGGILAPNEFRHMVTSQGAYPIELNRRWWRTTNPCQGRHLNGLAVRP